MPGTAVEIALVSPPLAWPGFGLNVSNWLGPPCIQSKMHAMPRWRRSSARTVTMSVQLSMPPARAAAETPLRKSRRANAPSRLALTESRRWRLMDIDGLGSRRDVFADWSLGRIGCALTLPCPSLEGRGVSVVILYLRWRNS